MKVRNAMKSYQREFLHFAIETGALCFGEFTLKSGRVSPYFFNTGMFSDGTSAARLGSFYAALLNDCIHTDYMLYGPAYKGIPLATAAAIALASDFKKSVPFAFNRKEAKDHGEGGNVVGAALSNDVVIIDDVITAGTSVNESIEIINASGARPIAVAITLDRQEKIDGETDSAVTLVSRRYAIPVHAVANVAHLITFLRESDVYTEEVKAIEAYRQNYGADASTP